MTRVIATAPVPSSLGGAGHTDYKLKSDIAQFCLPAANKDENRKLAYVNSLCIFYIIVGLLGLRNPLLITKEPVRETEIVPVVFIPPDNPPPPEPKPEEPQPQEETPTDTPVVATVVAADPTQVGFAVPVEGPVVFAPARFAQAPPPGPPKAPTQPTRFVRNGADGAYAPDPTYPLIAQQQRIQGTVTLVFRVDPSGAISSVEVKDSSGSGILDRHALEWLKNKWRFPPGEARYYFKPFEFHLQ